MSFAYISKEMFLHNQGWALPNSIKALEIAKPRTMAENPRPSFLPATFMTACNAIKITKALRDMSIQIDICLKSARAVALMTWAYRT